jgi:hypothetical protein
MADWLSSLPTFSAGDWTGEARAFRVSAVGILAWFPRPWREQAIALRAHRLAKAYASARRLGNPPGFDRWLASHIDHAHQVAALEDHLLGHLVRYLELKDGDPAEQCREMLGKVTERAARCVAPLRPILVGHAERLLAQLEQQLGSVGQELVLGGGIAGFADTLAGVEGRLAALRDGAARHQAATQDLLRIDGRLLADLLAAAIGCGPPRPSFFLFDWFRQWRRRRWLARTSQAVFRVLRGEVRQEVNATLVWFSERAGAASATARQPGDSTPTWTLPAEWREEAAAGSSAAAVRRRRALSALERAVDDLFGPLAPVRPNRSRKGLPGRNGTAPGSAALHTRAAEDLASHRFEFSRAMVSGRQVAGDARLTTLSRLSQPLVPVTCWAYEGTRSTSSSAGSPRKTRVSGGEGVVAGRGGTDLLRPSVAHGDNRLPRPPASDVGCAIRSSVIRMQSYRLQYFEPASPRSDFQERGQRTASVLSLPVETTSLSDPVHAVHGRGKGPAGRSGTTRGATPDRLGAFAVMRRPAAGAVLFLLQSIPRIWQMVAMKSAAVTGRLDRGGILVRPADHLPLDAAAQAPYSRLGRSGRDRRSG